MIEALSAVTLATHDMARSVAFYADARFCVEVGRPGGWLHQLSCRQWLPQPDGGGAGAAVVGVGTGDLLCRRRGCVACARRGGRTCRPRSHHATRHGANAISISPIRTGTNSASRGRCDLKRQGLRASSSSRVFVDRIIAQTSTPTFVGMTTGIPLARSSRLRLIAPGHETASLGVIPAHQSAAAVWRSRWSSARRCHGYFVAEQREPGAVPEGDAD